MKKYLEIEPFWRWSNPDLKMAALLLAALLAGFDIGLAVSIMTIR